MREEGKERVWGHSLIPHTQRKVREDFFKCCPKDTLTTYTCGLKVYEIIEGAKAAKGYTSGINFVNMNIIRETPRVT